MFSLGIAVLIFFAELRLIRMVKLGKRSKQATFDHCDLNSKIWELGNDPTVSAEELAEFIPICKMADNRFEQTHPETPFMRLEALAQALSKQKPLTR